MNNKKVVIIGASGVLGRAITSTLKSRDVDLVLCYFENKKSLLDHQSKNSKSFYLSIEHTDDRDYLLDIFLDADIIIDTTSMSLSKRLLFKDKLELLHKPKAYIIVSNEIIKRRDSNLFTISSSLVFSNNSKLVTEIDNVVTSRIALLPLSPMSLGRPIHVRDFSGLMAKFIHSLFTHKPAKRRYFIQGREKMTLQYFVDIVAKTKGKRLYFGFTLTDKSSYNINKFLFDNIKWGFSDDSWAKIKDFDKTIKGNSLESYLKENILSLEARITDD